MRSASRRASTLGLRPSVARYSAGTLFISSRLGLTLPAPFFHLTHYGTPIQRFKFSPQLPLTFPARQFFTCKIKNENFSSSAMYSSLAN